MYHCCCHYCTLAKDPYTTKEHRSIGPELIWPNIPIGVTEIFEDILAFTRVRRELCRQKCTN